MIRTTKGGPGGISAFAHPASPVFPGRIVRPGNDDPYFGPEIVFDEPSGVDCMLGGVCPCGLSAGAPPWPVVIGPVGPCGCIWPLSFNSVLPVLCCECRVSSCLLPVGVLAVG